MTERNEALLAIEAVNQLASVCGGRQRIGQVFAGSAAGLVAVPFGLAHSFVRAFGGDVNANNAMDEDVKAAYRGAHWASGHALNAVAGGINGAWNGFRKPVD